MSAFELFVSQNIIWIITAAFGGGGFYFMMRSLSTRLGKHEQFINNKFSDLDKRMEHASDKVNEQAIDIAMLKERTDALTDMKAQVADIWKHFMRQSGTGHH